MYIYIYICIYIYLHTYIHTYIRAMSNSLARPPPVFVETYIFPRF